MKPEPPWDEWDDYANCYGCRACGAAEGYRIHNPGCMWMKVTDIETKCPECGEYHVDTGEWENRPHKTHLCKCGTLWRPSNKHTRGVLPKTLRKPWWRNILEFFRP